MPEVSSSACGGVGFVPVSTVTRAGGNNCPNCASNHGYDACASAAPPYSTYELDQRRKVEILKYKKMARSCLGRNNTPWQRAMRSPAKRRGPRKRKPTPIPIRTTCRKPKL